MCVYVYIYYYVDRIAKALNKKQNITGTSELCFQTAIAVHSR
jgi:hypothetical protein